MRRAQGAGVWSFTVGLLVLTTTGCGPSDEEAPGSSGAAGAGAGGGAGTTPGGGSGAGGGNTAGSGGSGTAGSGTAGSGGSGTAGGGAGGSAGSESAGSSGSGFAEVGVCGHRGEATVTDEEFSGFEEYFLIGEEGFGDDICVVRFETERSGAAPDGCTDCAWSHRVKLSEPTVVLDVDGVCENSELGFDADTIAEVEDSEPAYGFVEEFAGHASVLMKYDEAQALWDAFGSATYDAAEGTLKFERRNGFCGY